MEWDITFGGTADVEASSVIQTADGGFAIAGRTDSYGAGDTDMWFVKTDAAGKEQWNHTYGGSAEER